MTLIDTNPKYIRESKNKIIKYIKDNDLSNMRKTDEFNYIMKMNDKFPEFSKKYPTLFKLIISEGDLEPLEHFLKTIEKLKKGKGDKEVEEKRLGNYLANRYLPDNLRK
jgi:hypothetical protein